MTRFAETPPTERQQRTWLVIGTSKASGLPASVSVEASRDVLTRAAALFPWFKPVQARAIGSCREQSK
jgi:hypothetical protein